MQGVHLVGAVLEDVGQPAELKASGLWAKTNDSAKKPRIRLMHAVRSARPSRSRCTHSIDCCSTDFIGTKRIVRREAARRSQPRRWRRSAVAPYAVGLDGLCGHQPRLQTMATSHLAQWCARS
jgi:hypothetical protein